jgi:hypothetical protein
VCSIKISKKRRKNGRTGAIRLGHPLFGGISANFHIPACPIAIPLEVGHLQTRTDHCVQPGKQKQNLKSLKIRKNLTNLIINFSYQNWSILTLFFIKNV